MCFKVKQPKDKKMFSYLILWLINKIYPHLMEQFNVHLELKYIANSQHVKIHVFHNIFITKFTAH